ncbi:MAG: DUF6655 family protein [Isosphaeraceae bacterium]|nr:DUF6655 family protein [Isosphaeraceae bacterium]
MDRSLGLRGISCLAVAFCVVGGCGTVKQSGTARTGTEQLLLTNAWDKAVQKIDFRPLAGVPVYLDTTNVTAVDQGWVVSSLRQAMLSQGVLVRTKPEQAQFIVEARVGAYGTDSYNWMIGVPQVSIPPTLTGVPTGTVPEIPIIKKSDQMAVAKLALFAYDRAGGQIVWTSGTQLDTSTAKDTYIGGLGPIQSGSMRGGTEFIGIKLPLTSEQELPAASKALKQANQYGGMLPTPSEIDLDSFKP